MRMSTFLAACPPTLPSVAGMRERDTLPVAS